MKKSSYIFLAMITLFLSGALMACSFKEAKADFAQNEIVVSIGDEIDLDDYVEVKGISKSKIAYKFSNPSIFDSVGTTLKVVGTGKSFVYATYNNNSLGSMSIVVRKTFSTPTNLVFSDDGVLTWDAVANFFENETQPTIAQSYTVSGTYTPYSTLGQAGKSEAFTKTVVGNQCDFEKEGLYEVSVSADASGYFAKSLPSNKISLYFGYMPEIKREELDLTDGIFTWDVDFEAKYKVKFDEAIVCDYQTGTSLDVSSYLDNASAGVHSLSVLVYDNAGQKIVKESEIYQIEKFAEPSVEYDFSNLGGRLKIAGAQSVDKYLVVLKNVKTNLETRLVLDNNGGGIYSSLDGLETGVYEVKLQAQSDNAVFYRSNFASMDKLIYKLPDVVLNGLGNNNANGTIFNAKVSSNDVKVSTKLGFEGLDHLQIDGLASSETETDIEIEIANAGVYSIESRLMPEVAQNLVDGQDVYVLNSNASATIEVTKLASFAEIVHEYVSENSVFMFVAIENATKYEVLNDGVAVDGALYQVVHEESLVKIVFDGKIDDLFEKYEFEIVAKTDNDKLCINSSKEKVLQELEAPTTAGSGNTVSKQYSWTESSNADGYKLNIYSIDKATYQAILGGTANLDGLDFETIETDENEYTFANEGYYFVQIFALSGNEDVYLSSKTSLDECIYISEKLELSSVQFGYNESYISNEGFTSSTGYFLRVENVENLGAIEVTINGQAVSIYNATNSGEYGDYLLAEAFDEGQFEVSVVGKGEDETIYLDSDAKVLTVERLASVDYVAFSNSSASIDSRAENLTVYAKEGASSILIAKSDNSSDRVLVGEGVNANYPIASLTNFSLDFEIKGTQISDGLYASSDKIYLDAKNTTLAFKRLNTPTDFKFYNGSLTFNYADAKAQDVFVLEVLCKNSANETFEIKIEFSSYAMVTYEDISVPIGESNTYRSIKGSEISINLNSIITILNSQEEIKNIYNQAVDITFEAYVKSNKLSTAGTEILLSSYSATLEEDASEDQLVVEKMSKPVIEFDEETTTDYRLKWNAVSVNPTVSEDTSYQVYTTQSGEAVDGDLIAEANGIYSFEFSKSAFEQGKFYSFYVVASNPYYLDSNVSNIVRLYKIKKPSGVQVGTDGKLSFVIETSDVDFVTKLEVNDEENEIAKIDATVGEIKVKFVGKQEANGQVTTHYLDSDYQTWTVKNLSELEPSDKTISYNAGLLSWNSVVGGLDSLKYRVIFKDVSGNCAWVTTTQTQLDVLNDEEVYEKLSALSAGDIQVQVVAYLENYVSKSGADIYVTEEKELINQSKMFNCLIYQSGASVKKLSTPNVQDIKFDNLDWSDNKFAYPNFDVQTDNFNSNPASTIQFAGNYGDKVNASIFVNEKQDPVFEGELVGTLVSGDTYLYSVKINSANYEFVDEKMTIKIRVNNDETIPSSIGSVEILRSQNLEEIKFVDDESRLNSKVQVEFATSGNNTAAAGGLIFKINYKANGETDFSTIYSIAEIASVNEGEPTLEFDISNVIKDHLSTGGIIEVLAYVNSFSDSDNSIYYLSAQLPVTTNQIEVLKAVEGSEITVKSGGFVISTSNSDDTIYIVEYGASKFEVANQSGEFYFEVPCGQEDGWVDGDYDLTIYAVENGKVESAKLVYTYSLNRIEKITGVTLTRNASDLSSLTFAWDEVEDAAGYLFKMYSKESGELLYTKTLGVDTSYSCVEIFGENYVDIISYGEVSLIELQEDLDVKFEIITIGQGATNNSYAYAFEGKIKGNEVISVLDLKTVYSIDEFGRINFVSVNGTNYLYRYKAVGTSQEWREFLATSELSVLDALEFSELASGENFNIEIGTSGNEEAFELNSYVITTEGTPLMLKFNNPISSITYNANLQSGYALETLENGFSKILVGTSKEALNLGNVIEVPVEETSLAPQESVNMVYTGSFSNLIDILNNAGISLNTGEEIVLYFWSCLDSTAEDSLKVVSSAPYEFKFEFAEETTFAEIRKLGESSNPVDYANSYAVYANADMANIETLGVYVKIESKGETDFSATKFYTKSQIISDDGSQFEINLTQMFEEQDLVLLSGEFDLSFARLQVRDGSTFVMTDWLTAFNSENFEFTRLETITNLSLVNGNLVWTKNDDGASYYVYFVKDVDLETEKLGERYWYESTDAGQYDVSSFTSAGSSFYLAVQSYSQDPYVLPARRVFLTQIVDGQELPLEIRKNEIKSYLKMKDGQFFIDWTTDSEIYKILSAADPSAGEISAEDPFVDPFTFRVSDLIRNKIFFRFKFSAKNGPSGVEKVFDINAKYLLSSIYEFGVDQGNTRLKEVLIALYSNPVSGANRDDIAGLIELFDKGTFGVANQRLLFDEIFESLQCGQYSLQYCLLGTDSTLNSSWHDFKNENGENLVIVNTEPQIKVEKVATEDMSINNYRLFIKKATLTNYDESTSSYVETKAENYVLKLADDASNYFAFEISKTASNYTLTLNGSEIATGVTVYETDVDGNLTIDGEYLMFYINHNNGNSLLGVYGDQIEKKSYSMQVYTVGNDFSLSSKSQYYSLTLLGFGDSLSIVDGSFVWVPQVKRTTTIIYKKKNASREGVEEVDVDVDGMYSRYSLNTLGHGTYSYLKFVMEGEVRRNAIFVDSEVYVINNVYKLSMPTLRNDFGYLTIDDAENNRYYNASYSDINLYNYKIYNDVTTYNSSDTSTYMRIADDNNGANALYYQPGVTGIDRYNEMYDFKLKETLATQFSVSSVGTNVQSMTYEKDETVENDYKKNYHLRTLYCLDAEGQKVDYNLKGVSIASEFATFDARMLEGVGELFIDKGVVSWTEATESEPDVDGNVRQISNTTIYKVSVVLYTESQAAEGVMVDTNIMEELTYYTANTYFDFAKIESDLQPLTTADSMLAITVQALALERSDTFTANSNYVQLVEGGYAKGNGTYVINEGENVIYKVLIGNGSSAGSITRFAPITGLSVFDGKLTWKFQAEAGLSDEQFRNLYDFEVVQFVGDEQEAVSGEYVVSEPISGTYEIVFVEDKGSMKTGASTIKVYTTQGAENDGWVVKSFATEIEINKLETVVASDYTIQSDADIEILDFTSYFVQNPTYLIEANIVINEEISETFNFSASVAKLYILREEKPDLTISSDFAGAIVIGDSEVAKITFKVMEAAPNKVFSDYSDQFILQRSNWGEGTSILWDSEAQQFTWSYGYNSVSEALETQQLEKVYILNGDAALFKDIVLSEPVGQVVDKNSQINILEIEESSTAILYDGASYYINNSDYDELYLPIMKILANTTLYSDAMLSNAAKDGEENDLILPSSTEVVVLEEQADVLKILYNYSTYYISTSYSDGENQQPTCEDKNVSLKLGGLVKIVKEIEATSTVIVETESGALCEIEASKITKPVYTVTATYGEENQIVRTYTTTESYFKPNITGKVTIKVSVKLGTGNIQSVELEYNGVEEFNLFESGDGSALNKYVISSAEQFDNIQHRMTKDSWLNNYSENGYDYVEQDTFFYFTLASSFENLEFEGIKFKGDFSGSLEGNGYSVSYVSTKASTLSTNISVSAGYIKGPTDDDESTTYTYGSALFERFTKTAKISNLNISAYYKRAEDYYVSYHALMAGLVIENQGVIHNVDLVSFKNEFLGKYGTNRVVMVYSGIASVNTGIDAMISECKMLSDMYVTDAGFNQMMYLSGISYVNIDNATITACSAGEAESKVRLEVVGLSGFATFQVAGIVVANSGATLTACENNSDIAVSGKGASEVAYIAGIACYADGTTLDNISNGTLDAVDIGGSVYRGDVFINA